MDTLLTVEEVAALLKLERQTIYRMVKRKALPGAVRIAGQIRFRPAAIDKYIEDSALPYLDGQTDLANTPKKKPRKSAKKGRKIHGRS